MPSATQSIRDIVAAEPWAAAVFERFEIDTCSRADAQLERVCAELQLSVDQVLEKLADAESRAGDAMEPNFAGYSPTHLIRHIVRTHHQYVRQELPRLLEMGLRLAGQYGDRAPELKKVSTLLDALLAEMLAHMQKEEQVLFPFIAQLDANGTGFAPPRACFFTVGQPVSMMIREHESAEGLVAEMRRLMKEFRAPEWASPLHVAFYAGVSQFACDLRQHVHLENDILFPRAIEMESARLLNPDGDQRPPWDMRAAAIESSCSGGCAPACAH